MKLLCFIVLFLFYIAPGFAQLALAETNFDTRLLKAFEISYLDRIQQKDPILIKRWTFYLDHSFYFTKYIPEKFNDTLPVIDIKDLSDVNIFLLEQQYEHLKRDWDKPMAYRINNTDDILVYHSGKQFNEALSVYLKDTQ